MTNERYVQAARAQCSDGELEVDENAVVSRGSDKGAYVQAWIWVDDPDADKFRCQNCQQLWTADQLKDVQDYHERVEPGEPEPAGECPACGCVCHENGGSEQDPDAPDEAPAQQQDHTGP